MTHRNIPIFIPHLGCPNQCVFCNQRSISGHADFREEDVREQIEAALDTVDRNAKVQIAFFGGSFTGIERDLMIRLLNTAQEYVDRGRVEGIRLSTRPDYIDETVLRILKQYSVKVIELGLQSMDDGGLRASGRGHTARCAQLACRDVIAAGFELVGQMMIGLPTSTLESEIATAKQICEMGASACRIYPTVVFYDTPLCDMAKNGVYSPLTVEEAVKRSAEVLKIFQSNRIPCIRIGLCSGEDLADMEKVFAGPNHPALGELVRSEVEYENLKRATERSGAVGKAVLLRCPTKRISQIVGMRRCNLVRLQSELGTRVQKMIADELLSEIEVLIQD
jgi:histone acetyltransferase (RNA polymerase elongator complex component)